MSTSVSFLSNEMIRGIEWCTFTDLICICCTDILDLDYRLRHCRFGSRRIGLGQVGRW